MGRKNGNVKRSKDRGRRARQAEQAMPKAVRRTYHPPVDQLVMPDGRCTNHSRYPKAWFRTEDKAAKALAQAQQKRAATGSGHVEKRYFPCPVHPEGGYHLTSRESYEERRRP